jgi:hypothetical protein
MPGTVETVVYLQLGQPVAAKALLLSCGLFIYAYAPPGLLPTIPGEPQSLVVAAGLVVVGPLVYNTYR